MLPSRLSKDCWLFAAMLSLVCLSGRIALSADESLMERQLPDFVLRDAPVERVVAALNQLGIWTCAEWSGAQPKRYYGDAANNIVFWAHEPLVTLTLQHATVRDLIEEIQRQVPDIVITKVEGAELLNVSPRKPTLDFKLPAMTLRGPLGQLSREDSEFARRLHLWRLNPSFDRFVVDLDVPSMPARDLLNRIVSAQSGLTWHHMSWMGGKTFFGSHSPAPTHWKGIFLTYDVHELRADVAQRIELGPKLWYYHTPSINANSLAAVVVEKRKHPVLAGFAINNQTERMVLNQFLEVVDAMITEDLDLFVGYLSGKNLKVGGAVSSLDSAREHFRQEFDRCDYSRVLLCDIIDRNSVTVTALSSNSYRIVTRPTVKDEKGALLFPHGFWLVFVKGADGRWLVTETP